MGDDDRITTEASLACSLCGKPVKVFGIELDPDHDHTDLLTFECAGGHVITATFPE